MKNLKKAEVVEMLKNWESGTNIEMEWELKERLAGKCLAQKAFKKMFFATPADRISPF